MQRASASLDCAECGHNTKQQNEEPPVHVNQPAGFNPPCRSCCCDCNTGASQAESDEDAAGRLCLPSVESPCDGMAVWEAGVGSTLPWRAALGAPAARAGRGGGWSPAAIAGGVS